jgi:hypothetical protein
MKQFVFWTGVYNILLGLGFFLRPLISFLRVPVPESGVWVQLPATMVIYLGVLLILCSRNLRSRASIVCWEGILRIAAFFLLASYGFFGGLGISMALVGIVDLVIGLIYLFGLPKSLEIKFAQLLTDSAELAK